MQHSFFQRLLSSIALLVGIGCIIFYYGIKPILLLALLIGSNEIYSLNKTATPLICGLLASITIELYLNITYLFIILAPIPFILSRLYPLKSVVLCIVACTFFSTLKFHWDIEAINKSVLTYLSIQTIASLSDTLGYAMGKIFPLMPLQLEASPKKTLSGFIGATIFSSIIYVTFVPFTPLQQFSYTTTLFLSIGAIWGDLIFSSIKRFYGVKDFSSLIPGHGGVLDRVDSLIGTTLYFMVIN